MAREDVLALIVRHLREVLDDIGPERAEPDIALSEMGATSLDVAEVVARSSRELGVEVPRSVLAGLTDLDALGDLLYLAVSRAGRLGLVPGIHREALP
jgi:acyl carrier protein